MIKTKKITKLLNDISSYENEEMCMIVLSQKENKALLKYIADLEKLDKRIDKAIEYIEKNKENRKGLSVEEYKVKWRSLFDYYESEDIMKDLLNILKGSEE